MSFRHFAIFSVLVLFPLGATAGVEVRDSLYFERQGAATPADMVRGKVAGVRVSSYDGNLSGGATGLYLRGVNTLRGDSQPVWIVDGVVLNNSLQYNLDAFWQYGEKSYTSPLSNFSFLSLYDVEGIEVVKNVSEVAELGAKAANGVLRIRTRAPQGEGFRLNWSSNAGVDIPSLKSVYLNPAVSHNHFVGVNGTKSRTQFYLSAFYKDIRGIMPRSGSRTGGIRFAFDSRSNSVVQFGMNLILGIGKTSSSSGPAYMGRPSLTMILRSPESFANDSAEGWRNDYDDDAEDKRALASAYLKFKFTPSITWNNTLGVDLQSNNRYIWYGNGTSFGQENNGVAGILGSTVFRETFNSDFLWKRFFSKNMVSLSAGFEQSYLFTGFNTMNGADFFTHDLRAKGLKLAGSKPELHNYDSGLLQLAALLKMSYDYDGKAGVNASVRTDFAPRYSSTPAIFYSVSPFVDISRLAGMDERKVSVLKISAGYGTAGDLRTSVPEILNDGKAPFFETLNSLYSAEAHVTLDASFLGERLSFSATYYDKKTEDALRTWCFGRFDGKYWKPAERFFSGEDIAEIKNAGFEFDIEGKPFDSPDFGWTLNANFACNFNRVISVSEKTGAGVPIGEHLVANRNIPGYQAGVLYGYIRETGAFGVIGNPIPKYTAGISMDFRIRRFRIDACADGAAGHDILNLNNLFGEQLQPRTVTDKYVEKGDYLRLGRVSVSYDVNLRKVKWMRRLRVTAGVNNVCYLSSYSGWFPEADCFGINTSCAGLDYGSFPTAMTVMAGISVDF